MIDREIAYLFVYGTLMLDAPGELGRDMRRRLQSECRLIGEATIAGRLHDLGRYPGLVASRSAGELVHGQLLHLADPTSTLHWLDEYEGVGKHRAPSGEQDEYLRIIVPVDVRGHQPIEAWTYLLNRPAGGLPIITGGRWPGMRRP